MLGLSQSELGLVLFILLLIVVAGKLRPWGEALGSWLYRRGEAGRDGRGSDPGAPKA
jgi:Sec-independent protein translocase protein TatA